MEFEIYNYRRCPFCIRVRLVFLYKQIPFETKEEKLRNWSKKFTELFDNKKPTVPVLVHNKKPIFESLDIMEYLEDYKPSLSKEQFRQWGNWSAKELRNAIQMYKYEQGGTTEQGKEQVLECFTYLEKQLQPFLTGEHIALADLAVWPFVRQALKVNENELEIGPKLKEWFEKIENHEPLREVMKKE